MQIYTNNWNSGEGFSFKAPTVGLLDKDGNFDSFGYEVSLLFSASTPSVCDLNIGRHEKTHFGFFLFMQN